MLSYFMRGGICMWPLLALSVLALAIILEKSFLLQKTGEILKLFRGRLKELAANRDRIGLKEFCRRENNFLGRIFAVAEIKLNSGPAAVKEAVESRGRQEIRLLERHIDWLATIAGAAPLLGFLGTVTGMVKAFRVIEVSGGPVNPSLLAGGIWEALITTVFGLSIAIPCVFAYNFFVNRIENIVLDVEDAANEMIENFPS